MTDKTQTTLRLESPTSPSVPNTGALVSDALAHLRGGQSKTPEEQYIGDKLRQHLLVQTGTFIKEEAGANLTQTISMRTMERFNEFVEFDRSIREQDRDDEDQADMEAFCHQIRESQANSLLAIRQASVNEIEKIIITPLEPPANLNKDVIIEQVPGLFGKLFGGQQITRVKR